MKHLCFFLLFSASLYTVSAQEQIKPEDATHAIIKAFESHSIVMLGEVHGNKQEYEFLRSLVASPDFEDRVDDLVLEYGNSLYQDIVDRYVAGERAPIEEVQKAWRNTTAIGPPLPSTVGCMRRCGKRTGNALKATKCGSCWATST